MTDVFVRMWVFQGWPYKGRDQEKRFLYEVTLSRSNDSVCSLSFYVVVGGVFTITKVILVIVKFLTVGYFFNQRDFF